MRVRVQEVSCLCGLQYIGYLSGVQPALSWRQQGSAAKCRMNSLNYCFRDIIGKKNIFFQIFTVKYFYVKYIWTNCMFTWPPGRSMRLNFFLERKITLIFAKQLNIHNDDKQLRIKNIVLFPTKAAMWTSTRAPPLGITLCFVMNCTLYHLSPFHTLTANSNVLSSNTKSSQWSAPYWTNS